VSETPRHLAIIMDGNGRWAQARSLPRIAGHRRGVEVVRQVVEDCRELGVEYLTLYAFSSENWGRPSDEVSALMGLLSRYLKSELKAMLKNRIRLRVIGEIDRLPAPIKKVLDDILDQTRDNSAMTLTLALSYSGRNELVRACRALAQQAADGRLDPAVIDEGTIAGTLDTAGIPDPDLLIRTSGEVRISNFLLWQAAYAEFYFCDCYWPDFDRAMLQAAFDEYRRRQRRFGLTGEQLRSGDPPAQGGIDH